MDTTRLNILGHKSRHEWTVAVGKRIGSEQAALAWEAIEATFDTDVLTLIDEVQSAGTQTAILTNGTSTTKNEVEKAGVFDNLGHFFNSADIGLAKPAHQIFHFVANELGHDLEQILFIDDSQRNVEAASTLGMKAEVFVDAKHLRQSLQDRGIIR